MKGGPELEGGGKLRQWSSMATRSAEQLVTASDTKILYMLGRAGYPESSHFPSPLSNLFLNTYLAIK